MQCQKYTRQKVRKILSKKAEIEVKQKMIIKKKNK